MLNLFLSHGPNICVRRILLSCLPNGDWQDTDHVYYFVKPIETCGRPRLSADMICKMLQVGLAQALASCKPLVYPRSRWTGADQSLDWMGLLMGVHGLLLPAYLQFVADLQRPGRGPAVTCDAHSSADRGADDPSNVQEQPDEQAGAAWHEINTKHRAAGCMWVQTVDSWLHLVIMRLVMEPLRILLNSFFHIGSDEFEVEQRVRVAKGLKRGAEHVGRTFRIVEAALCRPETGCFDVLHQLFSEAHHWVLLPIRGHTFIVRSLVFRSLSRLGGTLHMYLRSYHKRFPIAMFALLEDPTLAELYSGLPDCVFDSWSLDLKNRYPSFTGDEFRAVLQLAAHLAWTDISAIEARHAAVRRHLNVRSTQTHSFGFGDLSAEWVLQQHRRDRHKQSLKHFLKASSKVPVSAASRSTPISLGSLVTLHRRDCRSPVLSIQRHL